MNLDSFIDIMVMLILAILSFWAIVYCVLCLIKYLIKLNNKCLIKLTLAIGAVLCFVLKHDCIFMMGVIIGTIVNILVLIQSLKAREPKTLQVNKTRNDKGTEYASRFVAICYGVVGAVFIDSLFMISVDNVFLTSFNIYYVKFIIIVCLIKISIISFIITEIIVYKAIILFRNNFHTLFNTFNQTLYFHDWDCMFFLFLISFLLVYSEVLHYETNKNGSHVYLLEFSLFVIIVLLITFMARVGSKLSTIAPEYKADRKSEAVTITAFIAIQIMVSFAAVLCAHAIGKGIVYASDKSFAPSCFDHLYFVIMTYTSVGYGEWYPESSLMKIMAVGISAIGFLSGVLLIGILYDQFQHAEDIQDDKMSKQLSAKGIIKNVLLPIFVIAIAIVYTYVTGAYRFTNSDTISCVCSMIRCDMQPCMCCVAPSICNVKNICTCQTFGNNSVSDIGSMLYYLIITFTSVGYGDIIPTTLCSKIIACIVSMTGYICSAFLISAIYQKLHSRKKRSN